MNGTASSAAKRTIQRARVSKKGEGSQSARPRFPFPSDRPFVFPVGCRTCCTALNAKAKIKKGPTFSLFPSYAFSASTLRYYDAFLSSGRELGMRRQIFFPRKNTMGEIAIRSHGNALRMWANEAVAVSFFSVDALGWCMTHHLRQSQPSFCRYYSRCSRP